MQQVLVITTGGTLDKVYFDAKSQFEVGHSVVGDLLAQACVTVPFRILELMRKDSLELNDADRRLIREAVAAADENQIVITHGTDTMTVTAEVLQDIAGKTIVLTGALSPARFAETDAMFNLGMAFGAVQSAPEGVWLAMNGTLFAAGSVVKDRSRNAFIALTD
ncbi:MAG: asparaginase [Pseudomonadales bacterium]|nr:asparaginase [Pseudomonadales bacterium]